MDGLVDVAAGWTAFEDRHLTHILSLRRPDRAFFLYEGPEGFGIARFSGGAHLGCCSRPLPADEKGPAPPGCGVRGRGRRRARRRGPSERRCPT